MSRSPTSPPKPTRAQRRRARLRRAWHAQRARITAPDPDGAAQPRARNRRVWLSLALALIASALVHGALWGGLGTLPASGPPASLRWDVPQRVELVGLGQRAPKPPEPQAEAKPEPPPAPTPPASPPLDEATAQPKDAEPVAQEPPEPPEPPDDTRNIAAVKPPKPPAKKPPKRAENAKAPEEAKPKAKPKKKPKRAWKKRRAAAKAKAKAKRGKAAAKAAAKPKAPLVQRDFAGEVPFKVRDIPGVRSVAPGNAVLTAVVDMQRLRISPHAPEIRKLLEAYPDYHRVVGLSDQDPTQVYDKLLVTTANPWRFTETMMLANVATPDRDDDKAVRAAMDKVAGESLAWSKESGLWVARPESIWWAKRGDDPRVFIVPSPGVVAFAKKTQLDFLAQRARATRGRPGAFFPELPQAIDPKRGALPAVLVIEVNGLRGKFGGPAAVLPTPVAGSVAIHDDARPLVRARLTFAAAGEAARFVREWPGVQRQFASMVLVAVMGYSDLIQRVQVRQDGDMAVYVEVRGTPKETQRALRFIARSIKGRTRHWQPRPGDLPEPETTAAQDALATALPGADAGDANAGDAGVSDQDAAEPARTPDPKRAKRGLLGGAPSSAPPDAPTSTRDVSPSGGGLMGGSGGGRLIDRLKTPQGDAGAPP